MKLVAVGMVAVVVVLSLGLGSVVVLGVLASSATGTDAVPSSPGTPFVASVPVNLGTGSWADFLAAHYETSGHLDPNDKLSGVQIAVLFWNAGCHGSKLVDIVAISGRESGWGPTAYNFHARTTGDISLGLTQINVMGTMMSRLDTFGLTDPRQLFNPGNAAHATYVLSHGCTNLSPWGSYKGMSDTYGTDGMAALTAVAAARAQGLIGD